MNPIEAIIDALTRPNIRALKPYSSARDEAPKSQQAQRIMLDANENSFGGPLDTDFSRYPDPQQRPLKEALARMKGLDSGQIFIGNGSDEAIDLLFRAFVEPGQDNVIILPPTYGMYSVQANIHGAAIRMAPLRSDFSPDADAVRKVTDQHSKLLFLCSPNNPTGQCLPEEFVVEMLDFFPGLVIVDEAYADFSGNASWITRIQDHPKLIVLQTLSKAWGLAGLRIGMAYANPLVINVLNRIKYPYNINEMTIRLGLEALSMPEKVEEKVSRILSERRRLELQLPLLEVVEQVFPSDSNFLLVRVSDADGLYQHLSAHGIIVRNRSRELHCENCLRITVGTVEENDQLLEALSVSH
jgi:histidinol-phosphate aminotransferase